jgi:two-component system, OmpR family, phosphate regulon response regulator PhoB
VKVHEAFGSVSVSTDASFRDLLTYRHSHYARRSSANRSQHRYIIGEIVERLGHTSLPFGDGLAMSKALSRSTVDMLILDWNTGALSGLDILKSLRSVGGERLPVLFASADISEGNAVRALSAGADDYVRHPVSAAPN